ncbi:MAG: hypothetical protein JWP92_3742 [Caulobacter sp.]|nr:hypothetical protein [Caulobacter sp.]
MSVLSPALATAFSGRSVLMFCAVEIDLPAGALRLLDAPGQVTFGGRTFLGRDPVYGTLGGVEPVTDGVETDAPEITITVLPPTMTAAASLASPTAQFSAVTIWVGALDKVTGEVIPDPYVLFVGEVDVPTLSGDGGSRSLQYSVTSVFELLFEVDEGARLNNAFHQSVWPGERGLEYVTEVQRSLPWGAETARPAAVRDVTS